MRNFLNNIPWMKVAGAALGAAGLFGGGYYTGAPPKSEPIAAAPAAIVKPVEFQCPPGKIVIPLRVFFNGTEIHRSPQKEK